MEASVSQPATELSGWGGIWRGPDLALRQAGADAERMIAQRRIWAVGVFLVFVASLWAQFSSRDALVQGAVVMGLLALAQSLFVRRLVSRHAGQTWIGFASTLGDVALVTLGVMNPLLAHRFDQVLHNSTIFPLYYVVIFSTAMRYDTRITIAATLASLLSYTGILVFLAQHLASEAARGISVPELQWSFQVGKLALIAIVGILAVSLIERSQRMSLLSTRDPLTGLLNRRFLDERLLEESERARRGEGTFALALVDVDHFKRTNDGFGHAVGDAVLREIAAALALSFRATDVVARFGGDEFALLLPQARPEELFERFDAARQRVSALTRPAVGSLPPLHVSLSIGYAVSPGDADTPEALLEAADQRLYAAKAAGRNCVLGPELASQHGDGRAAARPH